MMEVGQRSYTAEDTHNIPRLLWNLGVQDNDTNKASMTKGLKWCLHHGTGEPTSNRYRYLFERKATFPQRQVQGVSSSYLAEGGFYMGRNGMLACYQCDQSLRLQEGEDPLLSHGDLFPNCQHIRRLHGKRPRPVSVLGNLPQGGQTQGGSRRRLFSE